MKVIVYIKSVTLHAGFALFCIEIQSDKGTKSAGNLVREIFYGLFHCGHCEIFQT